MSNLNKDQPSIRVCAPPGGRSANIFGVPEPEMPMATKKHHMQSDIFGCKQEPDLTPAKPTRPMTNNIYGTEPSPSVTQKNIYSEKNRSSIFDEAPPPTQPSNKPDRQKSDIFSINEPAQAASTRQVADRFKSNIFGPVAGSDDQNKRQPGARQGLRVGYNPINGESYGTKDDLSSKVESLEISEENKEKVSGDEPIKTGEESNGESLEKNAQESAVSNGNHVGKNSHTNVRVFHPPGGRSNGPLW